VKLALLRLMFPHRLCRYGKTIQQTTSKPAFPYGSIPAQFNFEGGTRARINLPR
jgi:hypothetical protein